MGTNIVYIKLTEDEVTLLRSALSRVFINIGLTDSRFKNEIISLKEKIEHQMLNQEEVND